MNVRTCAKTVLIAVKISLIMLTGVTGSTLPTPFLANPIATDPQHSAQNAEDHFGEIYYYYNRQDIIEIKYHVVRRLTQPFNNYIDHFIHPLPQKV